MPKFEAKKPPPSEPGEPVKLDVVRLAEPRPEPPGLDAFAAKAAVTPVIIREVAAAPPPAEPARGRVLPAQPMPVRFPPDVRARLDQLCTLNRRSRQQILELVCFPALMEAPDRLP